MGLILCIWADKCSWYDWWLDSEQQRLFLANHSNASAYRMDWLLSVRLSVMWCWCFLAIFGFWYEGYHRGQRRCIRWMSGSAHGKEDLLWGGVLDFENFELSPCHGQPFCLLLSFVFKSIQFCHQDRYSFLSGYIVCRG